MSDEPTPEINNTEKPLFELEIGPGVHKLEPRSIDEFKHWLEVERDYWSWVGPTTPKVSEIQRQVHLESEILSRLEQARQFLASGDQNNYVANIEKCRRQLEQRYSSSVRAIHSTDPRATYLAQLDDLTVRGHTLRAFLGLGPANPNDSQSLRGAFLAYAFDYGMKGAPEDFEKALLETQRRIGVEHEALRKSAGKLEDDFTELQEKIEKLYGEQKTSYDELEAKRTTEFRTLVDNSNEKLANIERAFEQKTATKFAVVYFQNKARNHWIAGALLTTITLIVGGAFSIYAYHVTDRLLNTVSVVVQPPEAKVTAHESTGTTTQATPSASSSPSMQSSANAEASPLSRVAAVSQPWNAVRVAVAVLIATLAFWLLRLLVRALLSQMHLATDCQSRATLLETYIALLKDGQGMKDDDRKLILGVLFRPMSDGLIRDDAAPPGVWDVLTRTFGGK